MRVACMQPALLPPASYFRLFAASDIFVVLDNVQFNRRWYTHRQKLKRHDGSYSWFTLPLKKQDRNNTMISDIMWADDYLEKIEKQKKRFSVFDKIEMNVTNDPLDTVCRILSEINRELKLFPQIRYASLMDVPDDINGQDRILWICKKLNAKTYVNSTGGIGLYDDKKFISQDIELRFLPEWRHSYESIIDRMENDDIDKIRQEIWDDV